MSLLRDLVVRKFVFDAMEFRTLMYRRLNDEEREALLAYADDEGVSPDDGVEDRLGDALEHMFEKIGGDVMDGITSWWPTTHEIDAMRETRARRTDRFEEGLQAQTDGYDYYDYCESWYAREPAREAN